ncbi:MAG: SLBB domain-containing protein [Pyrinomonadaceae bacterium]
MTVVISNSKDSPFWSHRNLNIAVNPESRLEPNRLTEARHTMIARRPQRIEVKDLWLRLLVLTAIFFACSIYVQSQTNANLVHFGDLIDVDVVGSFEYDWRGRLNPEGFLDGLDRIEKQIYGLCRSESEIADAISKEYGVNLKNPVVVVKILDRSNRAVSFLDGAVKFPQRFQIRRQVKLNELLILSGGITDRSSGEISIFRPQSQNCEQKTSGGPLEKASQNITVKIADLLAGSETANPPIFSGDIVTVVEAAPVFLIGGVNTPKQISLRAETTLSRAIASAGGISKEGLEGKIRIFRRNGKESKVIEADLKKILAKETEDPVLQPYDVVEVEQKGRGPRRLSPVSESRSAANDRLAKLPLRIID